MTPSMYAKAIVGAVLSGLTALGTALTDGVVSPVEWVGVLIAVVGPVGDLFESALKRDMQVKDTGRVLGGHGGMLDRIDALLFAAVASYYLLDAFNRV